MAEILHSFQRYEKKFLLTPTQFERIQPMLRERMDEEIYGVHTVCSLYYDTPSYSLIRTSIDAPTYKEKFRLRSYGVPGRDDYIYAEIKKKCSGIVYKRRVEGHPDEIQEFLDGKRTLPHDGQIQEEIHWFLQSYQPSPKVYIAYERKAFLGRRTAGEVQDLTEEEDTSFGRKQSMVYAERRNVSDESDLRVTFDWNIRWRDKDLNLMYGDAGEPVQPEERIVMEVKIAHAMPLWLAKLLSENRIYPTSFSKYGTCYQRHIAAAVFTGGENYVEQYYDESDHLAAASYLSGYGHGAGTADSHGVFI